MKSEFGVDSTVDLETLLAGASNPEGFLVRIGKKKFDFPEVFLEVIQPPTPGHPVWVTGVGYWASFWTRSRRVRWPRRRWIRTLLVLLVILVYYLPPFGQPVTTPPL